MDFANPGGSVEREQAAASRYSRFGNESRKNPTGNLFPDRSVQIPR